MSLNELATLLQSIPDFSGKVAYYEFPDGEAPELPYIVYLETGENNFIADNTVFVQCLPSAFKLRLHKSDVQSARTHNLRHLRQNERL